MVWLYVITALQLVIRPDLIQESLEPRAHPDPLIDTQMAAHATEQSWEKVFFFFSLFKREIESWSLF